MEGEYKGPATGYPGECVSNNLSDLTAKENGEKKPFVEALKTYVQSDEKLEKGVYEGVVAAAIFINKKVVQFYQRGIVSNDSCKEGEREDKMYDSVAVVGWNRGYDAADSEFNDKSDPYWEVRWAYGTSYGLSGLMRVQKWNKSTNWNGPCYLHYSNGLPIMRQY